MATLRPRARTQYVRCAPPVFISTTHDRAGGRVTRDACWMGKGSAARGTLGSRVPCGDPGGPPHPPPPPARLSRRGASLRGGGWPPGAPGRLAGRGEEKGVALGGRRII